MLKIQLLGQFKLEENGEQLRLPSRQSQSLLAYLLLHQGGSHRREMVAGLLWPDIEESKARGRLRYAIWQLRKELGEELLLADKIVLAFNREIEHWLDVDLFSSMMLEDLSLLELQNAMGAYGGDLLPGFYDDWVLLERDRLAASYGMGMELLLVRLVDDGSWREVVDWAERWISMGHLPEVAYRALMVAHNQMGDVSSAMAAYKRCQQALEEQLAVEPSPETREIFESIAAGESVDALLNQHRASPQKNHRQVVTPTPFSAIVQQLPQDDAELFVGRESELKELRYNLAQAIDGQGRVLFLKGDAGRGKTSLMTEFTRKALRENDNLLVLWGGGEAFTGLGDPYLPFRDVLALLTCDFERRSYGTGISREGASRLWESFPESLEALLDAGHDLIDSFLSGQALLGRAYSYGIDPAAALVRLEELVKSNKDRPRAINIQHRDSQKDLFEQYTRVIQRIAKRQPLIIVLDDLHWVDLGSINLLFHLGRRIRGHPILILTGYRPIEAAREIEGVENLFSKVATELKRVYGEIEIDLDNTGEYSSRQFVDGLLDSEPNAFDESFRRTFFARTEGHPLFSVELLRQMQTKGEITKDDEGKWVTGDAVNWDDLPAKVDAVIAGRIDQVPPKLRNVLRIASVEGEEFSAQVVAQLSGLSEAETINLLSHELAEQYNIVEARGIQRDKTILLSRYGFRHHLFQTYVYNGIDIVERAHLHGQVGETIEELYDDASGDLASRLARHFEAAGLPEKAAVYYLEAGERAKRLSDNHKAIAHLTKAMELVQALPDGPARTRTELSITLAIGAPLVATKGYTAPEAEKTFERARELCRHINDPSQLATALWGLWSFYLVKAKYEIAERLAEQILDLAKGRSDPILMLVADWTLGITSVHLGKFQSAHKHLEEVVSEYDAVRHRDLTFQYGQNPGVTCLIYSAFALWFLGFPDQSAERCRKALHLGVESDHGYSLAFAHSMASVYFAIRKEAETSLNHAREATARAKTEGFPFLLAAGFTVTGWARAYLGKESMTVRSMRRGLATMRSMGANLGRPIFLAFLAEACGIAGQAEDGLAAVDEALDATYENRELLYHSELLRLQGDLLAQRDDDKSRIISCYQQAISIAREQEAKIFQLRAITSLVQLKDQLEPDDDLLAELSATYGWFEEGFENVELVRARELLGIEVQGKRKHRSI